MRASGASHPNLPSNALGSEEKLFSFCKNFEVSFSIILGEVLQSLALVVGS
jgi:hypothetical protein